MLHKIMKVLADLDPDSQPWSPKLQLLPSATSIRPCPFSLFIEDRWMLAADDHCRDVAQDMFTEEEGGEAGGRLEFQVYNHFDDIFK
jgi:hypothetical protein